jgi:AmmeMemoRadiSam system protein B
MDRDSTRPACVAGSFYPAEKMVLERDLSLFLENSPDVDISQTIRGIVVPHAGYMYSGGVAARAYRQVISHKYDFSIILAPSHYESYDFVSIYPGRAFDTPLGAVAIEQSVADALVEQGDTFRLSEMGYSAQEHSLEVQLPLLRRVQDSPRIVPLMMGVQNWDMIVDTLRAINKIIRGKNCLMIASTDLSHYHPDTEARSMDQMVVNNINNYQPDQLYEDIVEKRCEMCGYGPAVVALKAAREFGASRAQVLLYRNSSDMTGDTSKVVGYLAAVAY